MTDLAARIKDWRLDYEAATHSDSTMMDRAEELLERCLAVLEQPQGEPVAEVTDPSPDLPYMQVVSLVDGRLPIGTKLYAHASPTPPPDEGLIKRAMELLEEARPLEDCWLPKTWHKKRRDLRDAVLRKGEKP